MVVLEGEALEGEALEMERERDTPTPSLPRTIFNYLQNFLLPPPLSNITPIDGENVRLSQLLERAFTAMLRFAALFASLSLLVAAIPLTTAGQLELTLIFISGTLFFFSLSLVRHVKFSYRVILALLTFYTIAFAELLNYGYTVESFSIFLAINGVGVVLQGWRRGLIVILVNFATLLLVGALVATDSFQPYATIPTDTVFPLDLPNMLAMLMVSASSTALLVVPTIILLQSVNSAWLQETQAKNLLQQERDLLEQRVAERTQQLSQSETNLRTFINSTPAIIVQVNGAYELLFARIPGMDELLRESVLGQSLLSFVSEGYHTAVTQALDNVIQHQQTTQIEINAYNPALEQTRPYLVAIAPLQSGNDTPETTALLICTDISERQQAEQERQTLLDELTQLTTQQKIILDNAPAAIFMQKARSIIWGNRATEKILGYTVEEMRQLPNVTYHASPETYEAFAVNSLAAHQRGEISQDEIRVRRKDGVLRWVYVTGQAINPQQVREDGILWIMQDVTELKEAQIALEQTAAKLTEAQIIGRIANWEYDAQTQQITWSPTHFQLFGLSPRCPPTQRRTVPRDDSP
jgi:PAS domain S-box-containing protein